MFFKPTALLLLRPRTRKFCTRHQPRVDLFWPFLFLLSLCCLTHTPPQASPPYPAKRNQHPKSRSLHLTSTNLHPTKAETTRSVLVLLGDILLARRVSFPTPQQQKAARRMWQDADRVVGNLETVLGPCISQGTLQDPRLCTDIPRLRSLRKIGIHAVTLANNHMLDAGPKGLQHTRQTLERWGIATSHPTKACLGQENFQILRLHVGPYPLILLAINTLRPRVLPASFPPLPTPQQIRRCIRTFAQTNTVIVSFHGGQEYSPSPSPTDAALFRIAWKAGARAILGHHPHVPRAFVVVRGVPLAWGLGNAISDQRHPAAVRTGLLLRLSFSGPHHAPIISATTHRFEIAQSWPRAFGSKSPPPTALFEKPNPPPKRQTLAPMLR